MPSSKPIPRRRPQGPNGSSSRVSSRQRDSNNAPTDRGPDPSEFEQDYAIGDDESAVPSRAGTPKPEVKEKDAQPTGDAAEDGDGTKREDAEAKPADAESNLAREEKAPELPADVRAKLRKLEKLEGKYGELLKAYRTAHARVQVIEPFEASLRENTPLASIADPGALVEYLNQIKWKSDMVLDELKRVSSERDDYKKKSEQSEEATKELQSEVVELKNKLAPKPEFSKQEGADTASAPAEVGGEQPASIGSAESAKSPTSNSSRVPSLSLFSPKTKPKTSYPPKEEPEDLFSYDSELPRLESELQERNAEVGELQKQVQNLKNDLKVARESTEGMVQSLETATHELHSLRDAKDKFESEKDELQKKIETLEAESSQGSDQTQDLQRQIERFRGEIDEADRAQEELRKRVEELEKQEAGVQEQLELQRKEGTILTEKLAQKDAVAKDLEDSLTMAKAAEREQSQQNDDHKSSGKKLATMQGIMDTLRAQLNDAETIVTELKQEIQSKQEEFAARPSSRVFGFLDNRSDTDFDHLKTQEDVVDYLARNFGLRKEGTDIDTQPASQASIVPSEAGTSTTSKKKNKKKKKGKGQTATVEEQEPDVPIKVSENLAKSEDVPQTTSSASDTTRLEADISELKAELNAKSSAVEALSKQVEDQERLQTELESKASAVERLSRQLKDQEALQEEIETLRDDLLHQGEEHVEARDALKSAQAEKVALQESVNELEKKLSEAQKKLTNGAESEQAYKDSLAQFEDLKSKSATLQTDLSAAEQLATARFKDITDLRDLLSKAQPELRNLRSEVAELKTAKEELKNKTGDLSRLETRHEDLKSEMKGLAKRLGDKDTEVKELQQKLEQETGSKSRAEGELRTAQSDLRVAEARRQDAFDASSQTAKDLAKSKEESLSLKSKLRELEEQVSLHARQVSEVREELSLKTALHTSSQNVVQSLRDQTHELNTQAREATTRAENLEEELAEAQRMLSERTREGQTMRMLLNQAETGTEARIRDMKERLDAAIEERDRVEDEASVSNRRMMREVDDAKAKARDAQKALKLLEDEKDEMDSRQREWKRKRDELEQIAERSGKELEEVRSAMQGLREALDESERQVHEIETQKVELRKGSDEAKERVEKLTKANKNLSDEIKTLQSGPRKGSVRPGMESGVQSSRTSLDSASVKSPAPATRTPTGRGETPGGLSQGTVDYVYLKNVLLQFLEQKDKNHQKQLVPVLGMLLHFDR